MKLVMPSVDSPIHNDNRNYNYNDFPDHDRLEYRLITEIVSPGAGIIDLGCGNGSLMQKLIKEKNAHCEGIERSPSAVEICKKKHLHVIPGDIDQLLDYPDNAFDYAICNVTIQMVYYPEVLLKEMKRIAVRQIISFPNFGYFKNRIALLLNGRMPSQLLFGYQWYNTGHIHQLSLKDFEALIKETGGLSIISRKAVPIGFWPLDFLGRYLPNLLQKIIIVELKNN